MVKVKNKLLRWKQVIEEYRLHKQADIPDAQIFRKYIYPKFYISTRTFQTILSTPVDKMLKEMNITVPNAFFTPPRAESTNFYLRP